MIFVLLLSLSFPEVIELRDIPTCTDLQHQFKRRENETCLEITLGRHGQKTECRLNAEFSKDPPCHIKMNVISRRSSECTKGQSYGYDAPHVWVKTSCRVKFIVCCTSPPRTRIIKTTIRMPKTSPLRIQTITTSLKMPTTTTSLRTSTTTTSLRTPTTTTSLRMARTTTSPRTPTTTTYFRTPTTTSLTTTFIFSKDSKTNTNKNRLATTTNYQITTKTVSTTSIGISPKTTVSFERSNKGKLPCEGEFTNPKERTDINEIINAIKIDRKKTKLYERKLRSAHDSRTSSHIIGLIGVVICVLPFVLCLCIDTCNCIERTKKGNNKRN